MFAFITVICAGKTYSQSKRDSLSKVESAKEILSSRSLSFSIMPYIVNKAKATPLTGAYHLNPHYMNGFEAGPDYHINFNKSYSLIIGLHGGVAARNFKLFISKFDFDPNLKFDVDEYGAPIVNGISI